ncbi:MAG: cation:proton antiporter [Pseudomonadota bacterium]
MTLAAALIGLFKRINLPSILAYLVAGIIVGPFVIGMVQYTETMHMAAEVGIVLLLFTLGLEFSLAKLIAMRSLVFGFGGSQMIATTLVFAFIAWMFGQTPASAFILGGILALSSTAVVIKHIDEQGRLNTKRSQLAIAVLLFQDLAVVPLLIIIPLVSSSDQSIASAIGLALFKGVIAITVLLSIGKWLLPRVYNEIARTRNDELFVLTTLLIAMLAAGATYSFGLSMALGAFLAGMMLSESQYRHQLEADIRPFRDILMGLFFVTIGMQINLQLLLAEWFWLLLSLVAIMTIKAFIVRLFAFAVRLDTNDAWAVGIKVAQIGEFSFVLAALAFENNVLSEYQANMIVAVGAISMAITPWLIDKSDLIAKTLAKPIDLATLPDTPSQDKDADVLIIGFGRVGQSVAKMLKLEGLSYVVVDNDPIRVQESRAAGVDILYGDASNKSVMSYAVGRTTKLSIISFDDHARAKAVINTLRHLSSEIQIIVRTRKDYHSDELYEAGALQVVPEVQEGSLMLISQVLHYAGIPMSRILKRVRNERKKGYVHMHGFYPGETTEISFDKNDKLEFLHAVVITETAYANQKMISELQLNKRRVDIVALRRDRQEIEYPPPDTLIHTNDVLVISGKPRRVERIEKYLLDGG